MAKKTTCPVSRKDFLAHAKPLAVKINELPLSAAVREFSTGSLGWYLNGKTSIDKSTIHRLLAVRRRSFTVSRQACQPHASGEPSSVRSRVTARGCSAL